MKQLRDIQDQILVRAIQAGRTKAFDTIVARYERRVYNLALRMCGTVSEAEDITQETFVAAYRGIGSFKGSSSLDTWIHRIAVNSCLMRRRKGGATGDPASGGEFAEALPSCDSDPLDAALHGELSAVLGDAVNRLPEAQAAVVLLHVMQGFTYTEIASILECPVGTVKSRLAAAFSTLRRSLGGYVEAASPTPIATSPATEVTL